VELEAALDEARVVVSSRSKSSSLKEKLPNGSDRVGDGGRLCVDEIWIDEKTKYAENITF
jgi:hypothetical protein